MSNKIDQLNWDAVLMIAEKGNLPPPVQVHKSLDEWRALLTPSQFEVTRCHGTERPFTGALCERFEPGQYACVCCQEVLFDADTKFDSGTGWPSFHAPVQDNVLAYYVDRSYGMVRVEVRCNVCQAHLGHVFPDGPPPTSLRYCINSVALQKVTANTRGE